MPPLLLERDPRQQRGVSLLVRYFMIPCNVCLILLATSTLGFALLLFLNNCMWLRAWPPWARPKCPCLCWLSFPYFSRQGLGDRQSQRGHELGCSSDGPPASFGDRIGHSLGPWKPVHGFTGG